MQRAVCVCSLLNARQAWPCLQPAWNNITKTEGLSWLNCVGRVSLRQEQAKQTNVGCWVQTIVTYSVETVGNKWLKGWENGLPMPSRIATAFEAILGNSLKYKAPDFSNHFTTKGGPSSVAFSKTNAMSNHMQINLQEVSIFYNIGTQDPLNILLKYTYLW